VAGATGHREVILADDFPATDLLLTGTFEQVPLSVVLSSIALSLNLHYEQDGNTVMVWKKGSKTK
jgi:hypothetical protein